MSNWEDDAVLGALAKQENVVGDLVRRFPGRAADASEADWLTEWIADVSKTLFEGADAPDIKVVAADPAGADLSFLSKPPVSKRLRLIRCRPHYFRGYRQPVSDADLDGDLVVLEGPNSTGKTGLSEAIEWTLTGTLSRRDSGDYGHPRELEGCIANEFRPQDEVTRVELILEVDGDERVLKRLLIEDYSATQKSRAVSELYVDGTLLSQEGEKALVDELFGGVHPLLMQHTLRQFVHDTPEDRRQYFERLLQIDELTALIEKAVVGDPVLLRIRGPITTDVSSSWSSLKASVAGALSPGILESAEKTAPKALPEALRLGLQQVAQGEFGTSGNEPSFPQVVAAVEQEQARQREGELPILAQIRPSSTLPGTEESVTPLLPSVDLLKRTAEALEAAQKGAHELGAAQRTISDALSKLVEIGAVNVDTPDPQLCPLCEHADPLTLTSVRRAAIEEWGPAVELLATGEAAWEKARLEAITALDGLERVIEAACPVRPPANEDDDSPIPEQLVTPLKDVLEGLDSLERVQVQGLVESCRGALAAGVTFDSSAFERAHLALKEGVLALSAQCVSYLELLGVLEESVAALARRDDRYLLRDQWLTVSRSTQALAGEMGWERARKRVQALLREIRDGLIQLRSRLIEDARARFSAEMTSVWSLLRSDVSSAFDRLEIPPARGRGYKLEFEVRASMGDGNSQHDVSALKVFSESQINVVGIAAYVTRARLLGHTVLVFDDPVQSMDEEHHNSFASDFLAALIGEGFQVVLLTHSDSFAQDVGNAHFTRSGYHTLRTRLDVAEGCQIDPGSRRVSERLREARRLAKEGRSAEGWRFVRLAIERFYTLLKVRADSQFDHRSWRDQDAKAMWNQGVAEIVLAVDPEAGTRLTQILSFAASAVHDSGSRGPTDIINASKFVNGLMNKLRLGDE